MWLGCWAVPSVGVYVRVDRGLLEEFTRLAHALGMSRSEALRRAMEMFIEAHRGGSVTSRMRGLVRGRLTLRELEEAYLSWRL
jgi:metal-responsive CopG/Arc/MetJ family transcriptional regulator